jgi:hypothetical protein
MHSHISAPLDVAAVLCAYVAAAAEPVWPVPAADVSASRWKTPVSSWIGLRENLQETMVFTMKYGVFL